MKKNIFAITAAAALVLNIAATSVTTFAADGDTNKDQVTATDTDTTKNRTAKVELTTTDDKGNEQGIKLVSAPSFDFGTKTIDASKATEIDSAKSVDGDIQVSNPGYADGWTVSVKASKFTSDSKVELKGAVLTLDKLDDGAVVQNNDNSAKATSSAFDGKVDASEAVLTAGASAGVGVTDATYAVSNAHLNIPAGNVAGSYNADLTWELSSAANATTGTVTGD